MKTFCASCGYGAEYSGKKPSFCCSCGHPYDAAFKKTPVNQVTSTPAIARVGDGKRSSDYEYDDEEVYTGPTVKFRKPSLASTKISIGRFMKTDDLKTMGPDARIERGQQLSLEELNKNSSGAIESTRSNANVLSNLLKVTAQNTVHEQQKTN